MWNANRLRISLALCLAGTLLAQTAAVRQLEVARQFEVASIKRSTADPNSGSGIKTGNGKLEANSVTLLRCIMGAYGVTHNQIAAGPVWLDSDRFDISAKADGPTDGDAALMLMLQSLLAERFKLAVHRESKTVPAFVLEVAKNGPKLQKAEPGEAGNSTAGSISNITITSHNVDLNSFALVLGRQMNYPVINRTGIPGIFNIRLTWTRESTRPSDTTAPEGPGIFTALQEQLGLRLRSEKAPIEILTIDHAELPSAN